MSDNLRPDNRDIIFKPGVLSFSETLTLPPVEFRILMRMVAVSAYGQVWTYSEPGDGGLPKDEKQLARIGGVTVKRLRAAWGLLELFLRDGGDKWFLDRDWFAIGGAGTERPALPVATRRRIMERDNWQCGYCGTKDGPFDVDHVIPIAVGGSNDDENLMAACARCNRSKGAKRPEEWIRA